MSEKEQADRKDFPVLVFDAHERMSVAVIRSLGRAGYPVHACSPFPQAAGFRSAFVAERVVCPHTENEQFLSWLRDYCASRRIRCLVPTEPMLLAIRPVFREFSKLLPLSGSEETVYQGINKFELFEMLLEKNVVGAKPTPNLPSMILVQRGSELPSESMLESLGLPIFVKVDAFHSVNAKSDTFSAETASEARHLIERALADADRLVVQGNVPGVGVGAFALRWRQDTVGQFMHMRLHEVPGHGWSSLSQSWQNDEIMDDANSKLAQLEWDGAAMMEYRWNPEDGTFALIEMNGRFWGSLHLALYAGVDFPTLLLDVFRGVAPDRRSVGRPGIICRDAILDLKYVVSRCTTPKLGLIAKLRVVIQYVCHALDPRVKSALLFPGDRRLFFWICWQYVANFARRHSTRNKPATDAGSNNVREAVAKAPGGKDEAR